MCPICPCIAGDTARKSLHIKELRDVTPGDPDMAVRSAFGDAFPLVGTVPFGPGVAVSWDLTPNRGLPGAPHGAFGERAVGCTTSLPSSPSRKTA